MRFSSLLVLSALVLAAGCKDKKDNTNPPTAQTPEAEDTSFAEDGTDSSAADADTALVASSLVTAAPGGVELASELGAYVRPRCVSVQPVAAGADIDVTYTFDNCQGRNGLRDLTGVVVARATVAANTLELHLTFNDLKVSGAVVDGSATAKIVATGAARTMTWTATLDGTTAGARKFTYNSSHTVAWTLGGACFAVEGSATGSVAGRGIKTEIQDFRKCGRGCPDAGGKIIVTNIAKNKQTTLEYDGTNRATFTGPTGKETVIPLLCKP